MAHFKKLGTPLHSVQRYPTTNHQEDRFTKLGWKSARARNLWDLWSDPDFINDIEQTYLNEIEPFDEWEEFALFGCHYVLLIASTTEQVEVQRNTTGNGKSDSEYPEGSDYPATAVFSEYSNGKGCNRFASAIPMRSTSRPSDNMFGVFGGVGTTTRVSSVDVYTSTGSCLNAIRKNTSTDVPSARMCHTTTDLDDVGTLLVGGRSSPDNAYGDCWLYHKYLNMWERVDDIPSPRYRHTSVSLGGGYVLVTPGRSSSIKLAKDFLVWHRDYGWRQCRHDAEGEYVPTFGGVAFTLGNRVNDSEPTYGIFAGGLTKAGVVTTSVYKWTLKNLESDVSFT